MFGCDVYVLDVDGALAPMSSPRRITPSAVPLIGSLAWTRDGRSVIYNSLSPLITYLWRVAVDGTRPPERIEVAGLGAAMPAMALSRDRLAFVRIVVDTDVYRFTPGRPSVPVLVSSFLEAETRFSPDGRRLAFSSMRSADTFRIWLAASDGSGAQQLDTWSRVRAGLALVVARRTAGSRLMRSPTIGTPTSGPWTPMGARRVRSRPIPAIRMSRTGPATADGSTSPPIAGPGETSGACRLTGGPSQPVTRGGSGEFACESPDGQEPSCINQPTPTRRCSPCRLNGGAARQLVACVKPSAFAAGPERRVLRGVRSRSRIRRFT